MTQNTNTHLILSALIAMQSEISEKGMAKTLSAKDKDGKELYKARGIDAVYNFLSPLFAKHNIVIGVTCLTKEREAVQTRYSIQYQTFLTVEYSFTSAIDGSCHKITVFGEANDHGDKGTAKALSMAFKCACFQVFCIPVCQDPDATVSEAITNEDYQNSKRNVRHSIINTENTSKISQEQAQHLGSMLQRCGQNIADLLQHFNVQNLNDLTIPMYEATLKGLSEAGLNQQEFISQQQLNQLIGAIQQGGWNPQKLLTRYKIKDFSQMSVLAFNEVMKSLDKYLQEQQSINQQPHQNNQPPNNDRNQRQKRNHGNVRNANYH